MTSDRLEQEGGRTGSGLWGGGTANSIIRWRGGPLQTENCRARTISHKGPKGEERKTEFAAQLGKGDEW